MFRAEWVNSYLKQHLAKAAALAASDMNTEGAFALFLAAELQVVAEKLHEQKHIYAILPELERAIKDVKQPLDGDE